MSHIVISHADEIAPAAFPALTGVSADSGIQSKGVVAKEDRPLYVWVHQLPPQAEIRWSKPPVGHVVYIWEGDAAADGKTLQKGAVLAVEHQGEAVLRAGAGGARLVHYHQREAVASPARAGGHAHVIGKNGVFRGANAERGSVYTMWMEAACPTCSMWFHKAAYVKPFPQGNPHYHTQDEIIFVVEGNMVLGRKAHGPGTALAIDANTVYGFGMDEPGMAFINFRLSEPTVVMMSRDGPLGPARNEREMFRKFTPVVEEAS